MKYVFPILLIIVFVTSCKSDKTADNRETEVEQAAPVPLASNDPIAQNTMKLLQGTWNSRDDKNTSITFENNTRVETRNGKSLGKIRYFEITDQCNNDTANGKKIVKAKGKYLSMQDIDMCYYIKKITRAELELSYVGRDNTLSYIKNTASSKKLSTQGTREIQRKKSEK